MKLKLEFEKYIRDCLLESSICVMLENLTLLMKEFSCMISKKIKLQFSRYRSENVVLKIMRAEFIPRIKLTKKLPIILKF